MPPPAAASQVVPLIMPGNVPQVVPLAQPISLCLWRRLPPPLRRRALARAAAWLAPRPSACAPPVQPGVIIAGELRRASGLGEGARLMTEALRGLGLPVWIRDLPPLADVATEVAAAPAATAPPPPHVPLVLHVNAPMLPLALLRLPRPVTRGRPIIGYWAWELPQMPPEWRPALACVTEVWVPSRFTAMALEPHRPGGVRVVPPPLAAVPPRPSALQRSAFGLPENAVVVLTSFSLASSLARKNPYAAIAAFHAAFGDRPDRILVMKITHPNHAPNDFASLAQFARSPNIRLETRMLSSDDRHALTACADIVLSLHRSEGFGLVLAEAMLMGKAVIATGWSGNTEFMDASNAALVNYRLVPARDNRGIYRNSLWAHPDLDHAVARLRELADDAPSRVALGQRAKASASTQLGADPLADALRGLGMRIPL